MNDQMYRRGMGYTYNPVLLQRERNNFGVSERAGGMVYDTDGSVTWPDMVAKVSPEQSQELSIGERIESITGMLNYFEDEMSRSGSLTRKELDPAKMEIDRLCAEFAQQLNNMEMQDQLFSKGVLEWAQNARDLFAQDRGETTDFSEEDQLLEEIKIYEAMVAELETDGESRQLIDIANTRRYEAISRLSAAQIQELYDQAA